MTHTILTPGAKQRLLEKLDELTVYVRMDQDRETIMYWAAQIMPACVSGVNYYVPPKKTKKTKH